MNRAHNPFLTAYALLVYAFLFAPILVPHHLLLQPAPVAASSGMASRPTGIRSCSPTKTWSTRSSSSLQVAAVAVVVSTVLGTFLGLGLARLRFRGRAATETLLLLPMVTPEIVMGLSLLLFFLQLFDARGSFGQLTIAHITFCISYVAITVRARAAGMDVQLEEAARDLGASAAGPSGTSRCH